jgi:hypothetical protein
VSGVHDCGPTACLGISAGKSHKRGLIGRTFHETRIAQQLR